MKMKGSIVAFLRQWTLPLGMLAGVGIYLMFHYIPWLAPLKALAGGAETYVMPSMIFVMLFATFCKVNPHEMRLRRWHVAMILLQLACCLAVAAAARVLRGGGYDIVLQGLLVCLIAPTGTAAAVMAGRLGGDETTLTTYTIVSNLVAAVMIPAVFPLVGAHGAGTFGVQFALILRHVFPLLICPFLAAWALRQFLPRLHAVVVRVCGDVAFYLWGVSLVIAIGLTLRSVVNGHYGGHILLLLSLSAAVACVWQFGTGKLAGRHYGDYISCGQGCGQKNTLLAIWTAYTYLSPVISVAPSCYIICQNIVNSWQLWVRERRNGGHNNEVKRNTGKR